MSMFLNATADINTYIDQANAVIRGNYNAATGIHRELLGQ